MGANLNPEGYSMHKRSSGILLHITSLPGSPGIGTIGKPAHRFIDALKNAGQTLWQILPLGPTGYGDSPYAPFSSFAGNEILIDCHELAEAGLLPESSLAALDSLPAHTVDYWAVKQTVLPLLTQAAEQFLKMRPDDTAYQAFKQEQSYWLEDYTVFRSIKNHYDTKAQQEGAVSTWNSYWPMELRQHTSKAVLEWKKDYAHEIEVLKVIQFFFFSQWSKLKRYAQEQSVAIIGDIPIFVALDSADVWSHPELFNLDKNYAPLTVAGVPPDYFSPTGQLWGNPTYRWSEHKKTKFAWWIERMRISMELYDYVRIDHFRGFAGYWSVPAGNPTAEHGEWLPAEGKALFTQMEQVLGKPLPIIAEDLGVITDDVVELMETFDFPGMKVLQFAFDGQRIDNFYAGTNQFLPHNCPIRSVIYTGTHDNDTLAGKYSKAPDWEKTCIAEYLGYWPESFTKALVQEALKSVSQFAVIPMQDILELGSDARMNTPSVLGGNWLWRMKSDDFNASQQTWLKAVSLRYGRNLPDASK